MGEVDEIYVPGFKPASISADEILSDLAFAESNRVFSGVEVIDSVTSGFLPGDMVLIGAKTGVGKTDIATQIALHNALAGKRVFMYALEAEKKEIQKRILYKKITEKARAINPRKRFNYKHWSINRYPGLNAYIQDCIEEIQNFKNLFIFNREKNFGIHEFEKETMAIKDMADLIIIDHIHYFDLEGDNENKAMSELIRRIRDLNLKAGIPFIVLGHLRKGSSVNQKLVPDIEDFMGSSDLSKVCTKAVILAPGGYRDGVSDTFFSFPKFRGFSVPSRYLFKSEYNLSTNEYGHQFTVAKNDKSMKSADDFIENIVDNERLTWLG